MGFLYCPVYITMPVKLFCLFPCSFPPCYHDCKRPQGQVLDWVYFVPNTKALNKPLSKALNKPLSKVWIILPEGAKPRTQIYLLSVILHISQWSKMTKRLGKQRAEHFWIIKTRTVAPRSPRGATSHTGENRPRLVFPTRSNQGNHRDLWPSWHRETRHVGFFLLILNISREVWKMESKGKAAL